jgi:hypothetical protein
LSLHPFRVRSFVSLLTIVVPAAMAACFSKGSSTSAGPPSLDAGFDVVDFDVTTSNDAAPEAEAGAPIDSGSLDAVPDAADAGVGEAGPPVALATNLVSPYAIAVNTTDVYWTQDLGGAVGATLLRVPIVGGATTTLSTGVNGYALALDANDVTWDQGLPLLSMPLTGGTITTLVASFQGASGGQISVAAGAVWGTQGNTGVWSVPVTGGTQTNTFPQPYGTAGSVVDGTSIYWLQIDTPAIIEKAALTGGAPITLVTPDADGGPYQQVTDTVYQNLTVDGANLYWGNTIDRTLRKVAKNGGAPVVLATSPGPGPASIATDGVSVYWFSAGPNALMKTPVGGGASVTLVSGAAVAAVQPGAQTPIVAVDATNVYWFDATHLYKAAK